jgi:hypothetical protein
LNFLDRFSKKIQTKFHENPSSGVRVVPCGQAHKQAASLIDGRTDRETDMMKLIVAFHNLANVLEILISGVGQLG